MTPGPTGSTQHPFRLDRDRAAVELSDPEGDLWPVNPYSDADELNLLLEAAQSAGVLTALAPAAALYVYPMSLTEPEPLLAVNPGRPPLLLGQALRLGEREGEDPIAFTLRLLEGIAAEAKALLLEAGADGARLDRIAAFMNRPGQWNGDSVCEMVATELRESGRPLLDKDGIETPDGVD
jgi:hypothetical protein